MHSEMMMENDKTATGKADIVHKFIVHKVLTLTAKKRDQRDYRNSDKTG